MTTEERIVQAPAFEGWAIVELMGHRLRAGFVKEVEFAGGKMLRIDIPTSATTVTEFYSVSAIYALRPCTEELARDMAQDHGDPRPIRPVSYRERPKISDNRSDDRYPDDDYPHG